MALLSPVRGVQRQPYLRRAYITSIWRGVLRVSAWPRHRPAPPTLSQKRIRDRLAETVAAAKRLKAWETVPIYNAIQEHNRTHQGMKGSAAIRPEDWQHARLSGRMYEIQLPEGPVLHTRAQLDDLSDDLDWISDTPGVILSRGYSTWAGALPAPVGGKLQAFDDPGPDDAAPLEHSFPAHRGYY